MAGAGQAAFRQGWRGPLALAGIRRAHAGFDPGPVFRAALAVEIERRRLFPWIAVAFGGGILLFFAADAPSLWAPLTGAAVAGGAAFGVRARPLGLALVVGLAAVLLGFAAGVLRTRIVAGPRLDRVTIARLSGFVESVEERQEGARLIVLVRELGDLGPERRPSRVRVSLRKATLLQPGDFVSATARLLPPPEPARPGGYDFGRDAFFRGLGAVGSLVGKVEIRPPPEPVPFWLSVSAAIDRARNALTRRIADAIGGQAGAVAAALVTGKRGLIGNETSEALRAAGIYHVVSISGLHMVLAAGVVFWIARAVLALIPTLALGWPIKKIAAALAMAGATAYCAFSGWDIAAERSLIMTLVMLGATLVDRPALSMRNLALSALIVLAREPEGLLGPSFQMSYGAVAALIAASGWFGAWVRQAEGRLARASAWLAAAVIGMIGTTLVATLATAPFSAYHFQSLNPYGLIGNAVTLPLVSVVIMPAAVIGILAYPFGLDQPVWWVMGWAVEAMLGMSRWVSGFDRAAIVVPAFGAGTLGAFAVALVLLTVPASALRWLGLVPAAIGLWLAGTTRSWDLYVDRDGAGAAVRTGAGRLVVVGRAPAFTVEQWLKADGDAREPSDPSLREGSRCDPVGCVVEMAGGGTVAFVADRRAFEEDCRRATIVVTPRRAPDLCRPPILIDRTVLARGGATAIRWTGEAPEIVAARDPAAAKPWTPRPEPMPGQERRRSKPRPRAASPPAREPEDGPADPSNAAPD